MSRHWLLALSAVVGVAIDRGFDPGVDQPAYPYFDAWKEPGTDERKRAVTVRHLLTMSSGLRFTDASSGGWAGTDIEGILNADDSNVLWPLPGNRWRFSFRVPNDSEGNLVRKKSRLWMQIGDESFEHLDADVLALDPRSNARFLLEAPQTVAIR